MKKIINLYGGPGSGKSTTAADLYAIAKKDSINTELVREYIKNWVWEGREIQPGDQVYVAAKQSKLERVCFNKVDLIITDSPMLLTHYYEDKYDDTFPVCEFIIKKHEELSERCGYASEHIFLTRTKEYNPKGRYQNKEEAIEIDSELKSLLVKQGYKHSIFEGDANAAQKIYDSIIKER